MHAPPPLPLDALVLAALLDALLDALVLDAALLDALLLDALLLDALLLDALLLDAALLDALLLDALLLDAPLLDAPLLVAAAPPAPPVPPVLVVEPAVTVSPEVTPTPPAPPVPGRSLPRAQADSAARKHVATTDRVREPESNTAMGGLPSTVVEPKTTEISRDQGEARSSRVITRRCRLLDTVASRTDIPLGVLAGSHHLFSGVVR